MAMDWLKGLVGPVAQFSPSGQPMQGSPAFPPSYGGPPVGGAPPGGAPPPGAWGPPPGAWDPNAPPAGGAGPSYGAGMPGVDPNAFGTSGYGSGPVSSSSYGTPPGYGASQPPPYNPPSVPPYGAPVPGSPSFGPTPGPGGDPAARVIQLENKVEELKRDAESLALFAQALLAVLEDKKVMTQQDFQEMRRKLDLMDGRLDDRIGKAS